MVSSRLPGCPRVPALALGIGIPQIAQAQMERQENRQAGATSQVHQIIMGIRASLNSAMADKRREAVSIDAIMVEDRQRIPLAQLWLGAMPMTCSSGSFGRFHPDAA